MIGPAVGEVIASRTDTMEPIATADLPPTLFLGALGLNGLTAYAGLTQAAPLRTDDIVFVSAAGGSVGSLAGQIARLKGDPPCCRSRLSADQATTASRWPDQRVRTGCVNPPVSAGE